MATVSKASIKVSAGVSSFPLTIGSDEYAIGTYFYNKQGGETPVSGVSYQQSINVYYGPGDVISTSSISVAGVTYSQQAKLVVFKNS